MTKRWSPTPLRRAAIARIPAESWVPGSGEQHPGTTTTTPAFLTAGAYWPFIHTCSAIAPASRFGRLLIVRGVLPAGQKTKSDGSPPMSYQHARTAYGRDRSLPLSVRSKG